MKALLLVSAFTLSACINMSSLQTAETLKSGTGRVILGGGYYSSASLDKAVSTLTEKKQELTFPYLEVSYRRGITDSLELGAKLTLIGTIAADVKYKLLEVDNFTLSAGASLGYVSFTTTTDVDSKKNENTIVDFMIPIYASYRFSPMFAAYTSPKIVVRAQSGTTSGTSALYGATLGAVLGSDAGVAFEGTYMKGPSNFDMVQVAGGIFF